MTFARMPVGYLGPVCMTPPLFFVFQEYPFFTLTSFPPGFLLHLGGVVSARSVKLLDRIHNPGKMARITQAQT